VFSVVFISFIVQLVQTVISALYVMMGHTYWMWFQLYYQPVVIVHYVYQLCLTALIVPMPIHVQYVRLVICLMLSLKNVIVIWHTIIYWIVKVVLFMINVQYVSIYSFWTRQPSDVNHVQIFIQVVQLAQIKILVLLAQLDMH
jgi:hypothetical protein